MAQQHAISAKNLTRKFGDFTAVDDVSFDVETGEIFGIIGPNGAGKTTAVNMITGMMPPTSGEVRTLELDPVGQEKQLREILGVQFQEARLPNMITAQEALELYSSFYRSPAPWGALAEEWGLADKLGTRYEMLSGGQKQRLFICLALLNNPKLVVLDELATGLDPNARRQSWELVRKIREGGATVLLVTHFMDEAEYLCDRIAIIADGKIQRMGRTSDLTESDPNQRVVTFTASNINPVEFEELGEVMISGDQVQVTGGKFLMADVSQRLRGLGIDPIDLSTHHTSLDELFVSLTGGKSMEES